MTIRGTGADNVLYNGWSRFHSFQIGVGVPLFFGANKSMVKAEKINLQLAKKNYEVVLQQQYTNYKIAFDEYLTNQQTVNLFENEILKDSKTIIDAANAQFKNGDINYMQWVFNINQSFDIKIKYVESIKKLNQSIIQLQYFTTNK